MLWREVHWQCLKQGRALLLALCWQHLEPLPEADWQQRGEGGQCAKSGAESICVRVQPLRHFGRAPRLRPRCPIGASAAGAEAAAALRVAVAKASGQARRRLATRYSKTAIAVSQASLPSFASLTQLS